MITTLCAAALALHAWTTEVTYPARRVAGWTITVTETL